MKLKSIIGQVLVPVCIVMLCIGSAWADDPIPDYSVEVAAIIADDTLTSQEKLTAQTELFGWDIRLELWYKAKTLIEIPLDVFEDGTYDPMNVIFENGVDYSYSSLGALYNIYIAGLNIPEWHWYDFNEGELAYQNYIDTYIGNYCGWET